MNDFISSYFIQTRQEIDNEKSSRDHILNFVILAIGALGFALLQNEKTVAILHTPVGLGLEFSVLVTITSLFWLRRRKLVQIAHRWTALDRLLKNHDLGVPYSESLESDVIPNLSTRFYPMKDAAVCVGVSCPIYASIAVSGHPLMAAATALVHAGLVGLLIASPLLPAPKKPTTTSTGSCATTEHTRPSQPPQRPLSN